MMATSGIQPLVLSTCSNNNVSIPSGIICDAGAEPGPLCEGRNHPRKLRNWRIPTYIFPQISQKKNKTLESLFISIWAFSYLSFSVVKQKFIKPLFVILKMKWSVVHINDIQVLEFCRLATELTRREEEAVGELLVTSVGWAALAVSWRYAEIGPDAAGQVLWHTGYLCLHWAVKEM